MAIPVMGPTSPKEEAMILTKSIAVVLGPILLMYFLFPFISRALDGWMTVVFIVFLAYEALALFWVITSWLAPKDILFGEVSEGTSKIVLRFWGFRKSVLCWQGKKLDDNGEIVLDDRKKKRLLSFGGLRYIGIPLVDRVMYFEYAWTSFDDGKPKLHQKRVTNSVFNQRTGYFIGMGVKLLFGQNGETIMEEDISSAPEDKENLPLMILGNYTSAIINPKVAILENNKWRDIANAILEGILRGKISQYSYSELIGSKQALGDEILNFMNEPNSMGYLLKQKGLKEELVSKGIKVEEVSELSILEYLRKFVGIVLYTFSIIDITPAGNYRELTLRKTDAERNKEVTIINTDASVYNIENIAQANAKATITMGEAISAQQAQTTLGSVTRAFYLGLGLPYEKSEEGGPSSEEVLLLRGLYPDLWESAEKLVGQKIEIDSKSYLHIKGSGANDSMNPLAELLVVNKYLESQGIFKEEEVKKDIVKKKQKNENKKSDPQLTDAARDILEGAGMDPDDALE